MMVKKDDDDDVDDDNDDDAPAGHLFFFHFVVDQGSAWAEPGTGSQTPWGCLILYHLCDQRGLAMHLRGPPRND